LPGPRLQSQLIGLLLYRRKQRVRLRVDIARRALTAQHGLHVGRLQRADIAPWI
jgi:hypothetical protein